MKRADTKPEESKASGDSGGRRDAAQSNSAPGSSKGSKRPRHDDEALSGLVKQTTTQASGSDSSCSSGATKDKKPQPQEPEEAEEPKFQTFPERLMEMLDNKIFPDAAWWLSEEGAFALHVPNFTHVLLTHFQGVKYTSYTRKLNKWGFKKVLGLDLPPNVVVFRHKLFRKGQPHLLKDMSPRESESSRAAQGKSKKATVQETDAKPSHGVGGWAGNEHTRGLRDGVFHPSSLPFGGLSDTSGEPEMGSAASLAASALQYPGMPQASVNPLRLSGTSNGAALRLASEAVRSLGQLPAAMMQADPTSALLRDQMLQSQNYLLALDNNYQQQVPTDLTLHQLHLLQQHEQRAARQDPNLEDLIRQRVALEQARNFQVTSQQGSFAESLLLGAMSSSLTQLSQNRSYNVGAADAGLQRLDASSQHGFSALLERLTMQENMRQQLQREHESQRQRRQELQDGEHKE